MSPLPDRGTSLAVRPGENAARMRSRLFFTLLPQVFRHEGDRAIRAAERPVAASNRTVQLNARAAVRPLELLEPVQHFWAQQVDSPRN